jgi:hypothetical protein
VLQRVTVDGTPLVVTFAPDSELNQINLIQPNGEVFGQREVATGSRRASFELNTSYEPGEYEVIVLRNDEQAGKSSVTVQPDLQSVEMGTGRDHPDRMWNGPEDEIEEEAFVTLENQGTGPDAVTKLLFIGDVPYPSDERGTNYADDEDVSGIYDPSSDSEAEQVVIAPGDQVTIYSSRSPFAFVPGAGIACPEGSKAGTFDLILQTRAERHRLAKTYSIRYSGTRESDDCEVSISEG